MQDEHSARCIFAQMPAISIWAAVQLSRSSSIHGLCSTETTLVSSPCSGPGEIRCGHRNRTGFACSAGHCRLAPLFLSNTANIGPSDTMLPWLLSDGAYKLAALPPSRNSALGQFSPSRNRRAKASNDTSARDIANTTLPSARTPTPLRALSDVLLRSKRGCKRPFITSIGPDCVAQVCLGSLLEKCPRLR